MVRRIRNIIVFMLLSPFVILSQKNKGGSILANGNIQYEQNNYQYAIVLYEKYIKEYNSIDTVAIQRLANCYRLIKAYENALLWYKRAYALQPDNNEVAYRYAELSATALNYGNAILILEKLAVKNPDNKTYQEKLSGYKNLNSYLKDIPVSYSIKYLSINTDFDEYSPQVKGNRLIFVSNRPKINVQKQVSPSSFSFDFLTKKKPALQKESGWTALPFYNFFESPDTAQLSEIPPIIKYERNFKDSKITTEVSIHSSNDNDVLQKEISGASYQGLNDSSSHILNMNLKVKLNAGPLSFMEDGKKVFYTRNKLKKYNNSFGLEIVEAVFNNNKWEARRVFPNTPTPDSWFHPSVSSNGRRLYFSSNMPGGFGGNDLYFVDISENSMSLPINLGPEINTAGNEEFPTIKGDTLFFSSDGHAGFGAMDIFKSVKSANGWTTPVNMGYPVNSSFDDFGITFNQDGKSGYFSSNRFSSDDIYAFTEVPKSKNIKAIELAQQNQLITDDYLKAVYERAKGIINAPAFTNTAVAGGGNSGLTTKAESIVTNKSAKPSSWLNLRRNKKNEKQLANNNITINSGSQPIQPVHATDSSTATGLSPVAPVEKNNNTSAAQNDIMAYQSSNPPVIIETTEKSKPLINAEVKEDRSKLQPQTEKNDTALNLVNQNKALEELSKKGNDSIVNKIKSDGSVKNEVILASGNKNDAVTPLETAKNNNKTKSSQSERPQSKKQNARLTSDSSTFNLAADHVKLAADTKIDILKLNDSKTENLGNHSNTLKPEEVYKNDANVLSNKINQDKNANEIIKKENKNIVTPQAEKAANNIPSSQSNTPSQSFIPKINTEVTNKKSPLSLQPKRDSVDTNPVKDNAVVNSENPGKILKPEELGKKGDNRAGKSTNDRIEKDDAKVKSEIPNLTTASAETLKDAALAKLPQSKRAQANKPKGKQPADNTALNLTANITKPTNDVIKVDAPRTEVSAGQDKTAMLSPEINGGSELIGRKENGNNTIETGRDTTSAQKNIRSQQFSMAVSPKTNISLSSENQPGSVLKVNEPAKKRNSSIVNPTSDSTSESELVIKTNDVNIIPAGALKNNKATKLRQTVRTRNNRSGISSATDSSQLNLISKTGNPIVDTKTDSSFAKNKITGTNEVSGAAIKNENLVPPSIETAKNKTPVSQKTKRSADKKGKEKLPADSSTVKLTAKSPEKIVPGDKTDVVKVEEINSPSENIKIPAVNNQEKTFILGELRKTDDNEAVRVTRDSTWKDESSVIKRIESKTPEIRENDKKVNTKKTDGPKGSSAAKHKHKKNHK